jgi:predicted HD superfamily hydrolase involved in NAD metabolism
MSSPSDFRHAVTLTGDLAGDVPRFLAHHGCPATAAHCRNVAREARRLAEAVGLRELADAAETAGWLHDVSAVIPTPERLQVARAWGVPVLDAEVAAPMLLHQKLSVPLAQAVFDVRDADVLGAIRCHTTLRAGATLLDKVVFLADKIAWDQAGAPPYLDAVRAGLMQSLDAGVGGYLRYLWAQRATMPAVHPWFVAAYGEVCGVCRP